LGGGIENDPRRNQFDAAFLSMIKNVEFLQKVELHMINWLALNTIYFDLKVAPSFATVDIYNGWE